MTSRDFCYWFQGFLEIGDPKEIKEEELKVIKNHLNMVFVHEIDPSHSDDPEVQNKLTEIHNGSGGYVHDTPSDIKPSWQSNTFGEEKMRC